MAESGEYLCARIKSELDILTALANYLTGTKIPDINSGLRIMKKDIVDSLKRILPEGFSFTTTITLGMLVNGHAVGFTSIEYLCREGRSKIRPVFDTLNFLQLIIRTVLYFDPLKIFLPASVCFIGTSLLMVLYRAMFGGGFLVTAVIFFICGIQLLGLGMLADLIDRRMK